jgi:hypothetical protein
MNKQIIKLQQNDFERGDSVSRIYTWPALWCYFESRLKDGFEDTYQG